MASLIPLFKEKQLKPAWIFDAGALIWRIFFTSNNLIIGETRNQETKSTSFFCIDIHSGKPLWQHIGFDEPWWIGIEAVHEKWMILHGFVRPDMPEHRGIRVIDIPSGKLLWRNDTLAFWFIDHETLYAHKYLFEKHLGCELDINTGTLLHEHSDTLDLLQELRQKVTQKESEHQQDVVFPEVFDENEADAALRKIVQRLTEGKALEGWIEYISHRGILIVSQYRRIQNQSDSSLLNNLLAVCDLKTEKTLYSDVIAQGLKTPSPNSFFIKDDLLIFIKHQTTLIALQPWKS
ncbi:MAG: DUF4905 domain-containing protein [Ignavibacteriales bacterium]|nr:DUF4905 domain-containing protein [Ignavibacteriales bacterium]